MTEPKSSPKFKTGDYVRVIREGGHRELTHHVSIGDIGHIYNICPMTYYPHIYGVEFQGSDKNISETCLELADGPKGSKSSSEADCIRKLKAFMDSI